MWLSIVIGVTTALVVTWLTLAVALIAFRPDRRILRQIFRILPDILRLLRRLVADPSLPRGVRLRLGLLLIYLGSPIDLVPDFIPVIGYADDAIITIAVLRSVARRAGPAALRQSWPGTDSGFEALCRLTGVDLDLDEPPPV